jgi:putative tryptophan/tyrosine transport system substrate-binding protein
MMNLKSQTMRRRTFITLIGGAAAAWPLTAFGKTHRIAMVFPAMPVSQMTETGNDPLFPALFNELRRLGYVEGQNLLIERYSGEGRASHYSDLAREVVSRNPDLIIAITTHLVLDFKAATTTIPIVGVFAYPVEAGIVASLARPGGNITGVTVDEGLEQWGKRIQLLQQIVPQATRLGFIESRAVRERWGAGVPFEPELDRRIIWVGPPLDHPIDEAEYRRVFAALAQDGAEGIVVNSEEEQIVNLKLIVELAEKYRLPAIYPFKTFVEAGGLMSYGTDVPAFARRAADMADQILKGAKPSEIPIFQPIEFELVINLKTAKALGLTIPDEMLTVANQVIE